MGIDILRTRAWIDERGLRRKFRQRAWAVLTGHFLLCAASRSFFSKAFSYLVAAAGRRHKCLVPLLFEASRHYRDRQDLQLPCSISTSPYIES